MATQIIMPQLGESVVEGTVTKWLKREGESVQEYDALLEVNTDKVDTEVPSTAAGMLLKIVVPEGTTVRAGTVLAWVGKEGETLPGEAEPGGSEAQAVREGESERGTGKDQPAARARRDLGFISPVVARIADENQIDLTQVQGSGEGGRITKKDVLAYLNERAARPVPKTGAQPAVTLEPQTPAPWETPGEGDLFRPTEMVFGPAGAVPSGDRTLTGEQPAAEQVMKLSNMRRAIAEAMTTSQRTAPQVTTVMEADLQRVVDHRAANQAAFERAGVRLTYTAYMVAATAAALREFPPVNSSWSEEGIRLHPEVNIGMAVSLGDEGLIVPVIRRADSYSLLGLARMVTDLADRARRHRLQPDDVQAGTFSITNHGTAGSLFATPILNPPQCAILGIGAIQKRVIVRSDPSGDSLAIRPMVYLSLTFDHRILDGASADGFLHRVVDILENWV
jgi:2-oxoglutarate dehydrogenase E2 component (dihydrolipoamide succinyltransferase)